MCTGTTDAIKLYISKTIIQKVVLPVVRIVGNLSAANIMSINVPSGSVVLVNINRTNLSWSGGLSITGTTEGNVLFNFYEAKNLAIHNIDAYPEEAL